MLIQFLIIQALIFIVLILILKVFFYRHLDTALGRLKDLQEEAFLKEAQIKEESERVKKVMLGEIQKGRVEAKRLIEEAVRQAESLRLKIESQAKQESGRIIAQGKQELERQRKELVSGAEEEALRLSVNIIRHIFTGKGIEGLCHQLAGEVIAEIKNLGQDKFTVKEKLIKVSCACPLNKDEKDKLERILSEKTGIASEIEESLDKEIIAGLIVQIGALVIDGSLRNKLRKAIFYIKNEEPGA